MKGFKKQKDMLDEQMWTMGMYVQSAVLTAVEHCLAGKKAKTKYVEQPFSRQHFDNNRKPKEQELSKDDITRQTELLFMKLDIIGRNYNLEHKSDQTDEQST